MDLKTCLPTNHIVLHLQGTSRREILSALCEPLVSDSVVTNIETFLDDLERREDEITTRVTESIALPHARSHAVRRLGFCVGIADEPGLSFGALPAHCCRLFFLIGVPSYAPTAHMPLLQTLAKLAQDEQKTAKLLASRTPSQAMRCLVSFRG